MKAKADFVVRNVVGEYILMPTNDNISKFDGTVVLNEVSAFIWNQLQQETTQENLVVKLRQKIVKKDKEGKGK